MKITIDDSEIKQLEVDLAGAPLRVQFNGYAAVGRGARIIQRHMRADARGHRYLPHFAIQVNHDHDGWDAEIGFDKDGQGKLANIIVFGSVNNAPVYDLMAGPRRSIPELEKLFADAAEESVLGND